MMEAERGNSSEAGEKKEESPSVEGLQESKESSPSSSSGSPALTTAVKDLAEKADSAQEVDTEVRSFCF